MSIIKELVSAIAASGWVAVLIIVIVCLIAMLLSSVFGIFFSGQENPETGQTLNMVLRDIDAEYEQALDNIIVSNPHDLLDISGARVLWKDVLAIYTVKTVTDPDAPLEVAMMDDTRAELVRTIFWDMNEISYYLVAELNGAPFL